MVVKIKSDGERSQTFHLSSGEKKHRSERSQIIHFDIVK